MRDRYEGGKGEGKDTTIFELPAVLAHIPTLLRPLDHLKT